MGTKRFAREERVRKVEHSTLEIIAEHGVDEVTLTAIAGRSGVSRQWLYQLFPSLNLLYMDLYQTMRNEYFHVTEPLPTSLDAHGAYVKKIYEIYFDAPVGISMIGSLALNGRSGEDRSGDTLHSLYLRTFTLRYVDPMVMVGYPRDDVFAGMLAMQTAAYSLAIAVDCGSVDRVAALRMVHQAVDAGMSALRAYGID